ncbi:glycosyltransferase family 25 protein [Asaia prunellae]|uniref:glycosyltransferase family 25 protein n=1 Tax=Asaia prunellae TaxID=610245 RepID=UPI00047194A5|nr:glycosyltransferase family 25 protein [Asaia prunellae]
MRRVVINRSVDTDRLDRFRRANHHVGMIERSEAVEGSQISLAELAARGVADPGLCYTQGALGAALSHLGLWSQAAQQNIPLTIFEDDALLCRNFTMESDRLIAGLPDGWDVALLGYNFNAPITIDALPGVTRGTVELDEKQMQKNASSFASQDVNASFFRLLQAFGLCAYAVSPKGARALLECCLPLRAQEYQQLGLNRMVRNVGIDVVTSYYYARLEAYGAFPPLAISPNDKTISTIKRTG